MRSKKSWLVALSFTLPALLVLGALVLYPAARTIYDSFFDRFGDEYVGLDNYSEMFRFDRMRRAILNSAIWTAVWPSLVTAIGLVLAVLAEKINWKTAFKLVIFLPIAIAVMSSGIIWRFVYDADPERGLINALINVPASIVSPEGDYAGALPSTEDVFVTEDGGVQAVVEVGPDGGVAAIGLLRVAQEQVPPDAVDAAAPELAGAGLLVGTVWRDTLPGDDEKGVVEAGEVGLPGVPIQLLDAQGDQLDSAKTGTNGGFSFSGLGVGSYRVKVSSDVLAEPWQGVTWLGEELITPAAMVTGIWIWAGFALVVIGAGLASLPREVLEAAYVDGATSWQAFRHVTVPLLAPVLGVVFVTLTINALKMFDLIVGIAPGSVQDEANVIALEMWRTAFTGLGNRGLGSSIAVFLFILIIPVLGLNIRRFKLDEANR